MVIGWDIGGVNTKVARVSHGRVLAVRGRPFELQRRPDALSSVLRELAAEVGMDPRDAHAVTMTAELSQMFRTKREGVSFVLDALEAAFPLASCGVFTVAGDFVSPAEARRDPLTVAAANWAATARIVAAHHPDALLVDVGTTTTDIIPIGGGAVVAIGRTDPERLVSGELVYTGAVRTPVESIVTDVPHRGGRAGVSAEGFALSGDVYVWRGDLGASEYTAPTPDGRPPTREFAGERLARVVCADRELIDEAGVTAIADAVASAQTARVTDAIRRVIARHRVIRTAVVTGVGAFLGRAAARAAGLDVVPLAGHLGHEAAHCAPAACVAMLLDREAAGPEPLPGGKPPESGAEALDAPIVMKVGGSLLADRSRFDTALTAIGEMARHRRVLVVPGGGPFADAVRGVDARIGLSDTAAHWMAILAMDQYAHLIAERLNDASIVTRPGEVRAVFAAGRIPVLAPARWLRDADPFPHGWDVTSDSIAAWVAGQIEADELMVIKPPGVRGDAAVDPYFATACPPSVRVTILSVDDLAPARP